MGMRLFLVVAVALGIGALWGCVGPGYEDAVEERYEVKLAEWQAANPDKTPTEAEFKDLLAKAVAEIKVEFATKYSEGATGAVSSILTGNWPAAAFHGLGLVGLFFGLRKRRVQVPV